MLKHAVLFLLVIFLLDIAMIESRHKFKSLASSNATKNFIPVLLNPDVTTHMKKTNSKVAKLRKKQQKKEIKELKRQETAELKSSDSSEEFPVLRNSDDDILRMRGRDDLMYDFDAETLKVKWK